MQKLRKALKSVAAIGTGVAFLGASVTGALALDLKDYPAPFVASGKYDSSNVLVVGAIAAASDTLGMVDIATNLQFESKDCTSTGGIVTVSGGVTEDIPLGTAIATADSNTLDQQLEDDDIDTLLDSVVTFQSADYDIKEVVLLGHEGRNVTVATSLTSSEDDYQTDIVLETEADSIKYYYAFDEAIDVNDSTSSDPLNIKFLGKTLKITSVSSATKFTAFVGIEYFMDVDDSVEVEGKTVVLKNVGSGGAIVIDVDGVQETIPASGTETVNGIEISVDETFYEEDKAQRSATLIVGKDSQETYKDGDAYAGEDTDDPDWVWDIANLKHTDGVVATSINSAAAHTGPIIGIENDFVWNDASDNPVGVGECIDLPNNYVSVCFDSLTVDDSDYVTYTFEYENSADLSESGSNQTSASALYFHTNRDEGIIIKDAVTGVTENGSIMSADLKTDKVWFFRSAENSSAMGLYYEDTNGKTQLMGDFNVSLADILEINYDNTKGSDVRIDLALGGIEFNVTLKPYESTDLPDLDDNITMTWVRDINHAFSSLGTTASKEEAEELHAYVGTTETGIGTKDEDHRTKYGIIIRDPKAHGSSDEVVIEIPSDQVQANVVVKGTAATSSSAGETCTIADVTPVTKLDTEIAGSESMYNLILVGGPCANKAVEAVTDLGVTCVGWELKTGEGMIKLAENGDKVAILVAGTNALDT